MATFVVYYADRSQTFRTLDSAQAFYRVTDDATLVLSTMRPTITGGQWIWAREILETKLCLPIVVGE